MPIVLKEMLKSKIFNKFHVLNMSYDVFYLDTFSYLKTSKFSAYF